MDGRVSAAMNGPDPETKMQFLYSVRSRGVTDQKVLEAIEEIDRGLFVRGIFAQRAYEDVPLPIACGQTISQPSVVGMMTQALQLSQRDTVLEVGTGSGYQAAILSKLARRVYTIDRHARLVREARAVFDGLRLSNVTSLVGDGSHGLPDQAPFDRIIVTAAAEDPPGPLLAQLKTGGIMVLPVGQSDHVQTLIRVRKTEDGLEYDEAYARAGQKTLEITGAHHSTVYHGDGRTFDGYGDYDVIYFYRPMQEDHMLQEMERHMIGTARPGTILIAPYTFALGARAGLDCTILDEPLFITGMTQAEADQLRHDARRTGYEIVRRACDFEFDPGFWSPVLDAASFNGANVA